MFRGSPGPLPTFGWGRYFVVVIRSISSAFQCLMVGKGREWGVGIQPGSTEPVGAWLGPDRAECDSAVPHLA
jgi:hypothetical protein